MGYKARMAKPKNGAKPYRKIVGFRPTQNLIPMLDRLEKMPHIRKTWAFNQAMTIGLPRVLEQIGA